MLKKRNKKDFFDDMGDFFIATCTRCGKQWGMSGILARIYAEKTLCGESVLCSFCAAKISVGKERQSGSRLIEPMTTEGQVEGQGTPL